MKTFLSKMLRSVGRRKQVGRHSTPSRERGRRLVPRLEEMETRLTPSVAALWDPASHILTLQGTAGNDACVLSRDANGTILLDPDGPGGMPAAPIDVSCTVDTTDQIEVFLGDGDDSFVLDETGGPFGPGFTAEASGTSEIEIVLDGGDSLHDVLTIRGQLGNDTIDLGMTNGTPVVNLNGDDDFDVWAGNMEEFLVFGQRGDDRISGAGTPAVGTAFTAGGLGLFGEDGNDTLISGEGIFNTFIGGPGDDLMIGGHTIDRYLFAGGGLGSDTIFDKGGKNDTLIFTDHSGYWGDFIGPVQVDLAVTTPQVVNPGNLTLTLQKAAVEHVIGSPYNDVIYGNGAANILSGENGNDILNGRGGADVLYGGLGDDLLYGGAGDDQLYGNEGNDRLYGGAGADLLDGGDGTDYLYGGAGDDRLFGGTGRDHLYGQDGNDFLNGGAANTPDDGALDILDGGAGSDTYVWAPFDLYAFNPNDPDHWAP
jgi:Ca2+-binding RTX toxin-like protein